MFHPWSKLLPEFELGLIHIPGRDKRIREVLHTELRTLVEPLAEALISELDRPFAFYGHSMGALLAFEVARQLRRMGTPQPMNLFISSRRAPQKIDPNADVYRLPEQEFITTTEQLYGALPEVVKQDPEILQLFLSIMRADFTMLGTYQYTHEPPLDTGISVFGGVHDPSVKESDLEGWREQTVSTFHLTMLPGDHFFIQNSRAALMEEIKKISASFL